MYLSANLAGINTIIGQVNKAKKPLWMALFLPIILTASSFVSVGSSGYQRQIGVLGGPAVVAAESGYSGEDIAMLISTPSIAGGPVVADVISQGKYKEKEGEIETAILVGNEKSAKAQLSVSQKVVYGEVNQPALSAGEASQNLKGYFAIPAEGFNWGILHPNNAVDVANACGTPITASADGLVSEISLAQWNGGYGHYVLISHPNGTKTRYAHMEKISASFGIYIKQGELIGTMGRTGDATGCHVHFEILGAVNPFAR